MELHLAVLRLGGENSANFQALQVFCFRRFRCFMNGLHRLFVILRCNTLKRRFGLVYNVALVKSLNTMGNLWKVPHGAKVRDSQAN